MAHFVRFIAITALLIIPVSVFGQSSCSSSSRPVLNSCKNNRYVGDETRFYSAKDTRQDTRGGFENSVEVSNGQTLLMRITAHNNAKRQTARNVRAKATLPQESVKSYASRATLSASNASSVVDSVILSGDRKFKLRYVAGSTRYYGVNQTYRSLPDGITSGGVNIGNLPAGENRMSYITFEVKVSEVKPTQTETNQRPEPKVERTERVYEPQSTRVVERVERPAVRESKEVTQVYPAPVRRQEVKPVPAPAPVQVTQTQTQSQTQSQQEPVAAPVQTKALPATGGAAVGTFGLAAMGLSLFQYRKSREKLKKAVIESSKSL